MPKVAIVPMKLSSVPSSASHPVRDEDVVGGRELGLVDFLAWVGAELLEQRPERRVAGAAANGARAG